MYKYLIYISPNLLVDVLYCIKEQFIALQGEMPGVVPEGFVSYGVVVYFWGRAPTGVIQRLA